MLLSALVNKSLQRCAALDYAALCCRYYYRPGYSKPIFTDPYEAVKDIPSGSTLLVGGFGMCGVPENLIEGVEKLGAKDLTVVSNNGGIQEFGLGLLLKKHQVNRMIASYIGENPEFERQYLKGELAVEFNPQGTMIERVRAGGAGIPAFYTRTGFGTLISHGNCPIKHDSSGKPVVMSRPKEIRIFNDREYVMETAIKGDFALVRAWKADKAGNLIFRKTAQNFNSTMAKAAKTTIVEVEELVEIGDIDPDHVHVPGLYVSRILHGVPQVKRIERRTTKQPPLTKADVEKNPKLAVRMSMARRAVLEIQDDMYVNLGIGVPTLIPGLLTDDITVHIHSENGIIGVGPYPEESKVDGDLINAGKETITELPGASHSPSVESFEMIRGGHIDLSFLGGMQVSARGDLANWAVPGKMIKGMGGGMDLAAAEHTKIIVLMEHTTPDGQPRILSECALPLTGVHCVDMIITDLGVFDVDPQKGLTLTEIAEGVDLNTIKSKTGAPFEVAKDLKKMQQAELH